MDEPTEQRPEETWPAVPFAFEFVRPSYDFMSLDMVEGAGTDFEDNNNQLNKKVRIATAMGILLLFEAILLVGWAVLSSG